VVALWLHWCLSMARADVILGVPSSSALQYNGGGVNYVIQKNGAASTFYKFFVDGAADVVYTKSTDGGFTWSNPVNVLTGTTVALSVWYNRWSGIADDLVQIAYIDGADGDVKHRTLDLATDTLGTQTVIFAGSSTAGGGALTVWRSRGTDTIRCVYNIDNGTEDGTASSTDGGATWTDTIADATEGATQDQFFGLPGWNNDANDEMLIFVDASTNGLSVKRYDDSGNTWGETAIIADGSFTDLTAATAFPNVSCFVDVTNSRNVVFAWTAADLANADLRGFVVVDASVTETAANVVLNSTDDQGLVAAGMDTGTGTWYVFFTGKADGSETFSTATKVYYKTSTDDGATWSAETLLSNATRSTQYLTTTPRFVTDFITVWHADQVNDVLLASVTIPTAGGGGVAGSIFGGEVVR
jgi:hypothetical protein